MPSTRYTDLNSLRIDPFLQARIVVCLMDRAYRFAEAYITSPPSVTTDEILWARDVLKRPENELSKAINILLIQNKDVTDLDQIHNAPDATVQTMIDDVTDYLVVAYNS